ncbi:MAG: His/Gly/Thr/Pro-type tRNA ligase C-terminal domain-containing protein, partial [Candidatus Thorarchaeota archaeon]
EDFPCLVDYRFSNLKNQLSKANDLGVLIILIIGPNEMEQNEVTIKNMKTQEQKTIKIEDLIEELYNIIDEYED